MIQRYPWLFWSGELTAKQASGDFNVFHFEAKNTIYSHMLIAELLLVGEQVVKVVARVVLTSQGQLLRLLGIIIIITIIKNVNRPAAQQRHQ